MQKYKTVCEECLCLSRGSERECMFCGSTYLAPATFITVWEMLEDAIHDGAKTGATYEQTRKANYAWEVVFDHFSRDAFVEEEGK